jgi:hypothetical protein
MHSTIDILICGELRAVDEKIVPVVQWLNNHLGVKTLFSCQGDPQLPYVLFICNEQESLKNILHGLYLLLEKGNSFSYGYVKVDICSTILKYKLEFPSTRHLELFVRDIEKLNTNLLPYQNWSTLGMVMDFLK